jgi:hypothetical protein
MAFYRGRRDEAEAFENGLPFNAKSRLLLGFSPFENGIGRGDKAFVWPKLQIRRECTVAARGSRLWRRPKTFAVTQVAFQWSGPFERSF